MREEKFGIFKRSTSNFTSLMRKLLFLAVFTLPKNDVSSREITCTTTSTGDGTFYSVSPDFGNPNCHFLWIDIHDQTLANSDTKMNDLVVASNITSLQSHKCHNIIKYVLDCYPKLEENATCITNCSQSSRVSDQPGEGAGTRNHWITTMISNVLVLLAVAILYYRYRHEEQSFSTNVDRYEPTTR